VLCSAALRARLTLEIIAPALGDGVLALVEDRLYGAGAVDLLSRLREVPDDVDALLVVGHNPGLQELAIDLAAASDAGAFRRLKEKFPTGALATFTTPGCWNELGAGTARLESLIVPRDLVN
jgi:phosphohistidine phosphatase